MEPHVFSSSRMEREFLEGSPPSEVLGYLDHKAAHHAWDVFALECVPTETQEALLARNDRLIDVALAHVACPRILQLILERRSVEGVPDASVMEAALSNVSAGGGFMGISYWLKPWLPWLAQHGDEGQLLALFNNQNVPLDVLALALSQTGAFHGLGEDRTAFVLRHALRCPKVKLGPHDHREGPELAMWRVMEAAWGTLLTLPTTSDLISAVLRYGLEGAAEVMISYRTPELAGETGEPWEQKYLRYLKLVLARWGASEGQPGDPAAKQLLESHRGIRETVVAKCHVEQASIKAFVLDQDDVYIRRGYYAAFNTATLDELKQFERRDGYHFFKAALKNPFFYQRGNQAIVEWFLDRMSETPEPEDEYETLRGEYNRRLEAIRPKDERGEYFEDAYQASHPEAHATLKEEELREGVCGPSLQDIHDTMMAMKVRLEQKSSGSDWWWLLALAAGYGLAKWR